MVEMHILDRLERRLEQLVEGLFARTFKGAPHPVEVARAMARSMDERAIVSLSRNYAPNEYTVALNPREFESWSPVASAIAGEIQTYLADYAMERNYVLPGPLRVTINPDDDVSADTFRIDAALSPLESPDLIEETSVQAQPLVSPGPSPLPRDVLLTADGVQHPLAAGPMILGRGERCAVILEDSAASREHARIEPSGGGYVLLDLGSKNGTYVNGERIERRTLRPGDRIRIGATILEFTTEEP